MNQRAEQKAKTRSDLIAAGIKLSSFKGFSALSLREVAAQADISPTAFYKHFRDMEELGLAMLDEVGLSLRQLLRDTRKKTEPGPDATKASVSAFLKFVNENGNLFKLLLGERQGASSAFRKAIHTEMDRFVAEMAVDLEKRYSALKTPLQDPALAAEAIVAIVFTLGAEALDLPPHKQIGLADRLTKHVQTIVRGSILPKTKSKKK